MLPERYRVQQPFCRDTDRLWPKDTIFRLWGNEYRAKRKTESKDLLIVTIRIGSVERKYQKAIVGDCTLLGPRMTGEPVSRSKVVAGKYLFLEAWVEHSCLSHHSLVSIEQKPC